MPTLMTTRLTGSVSVQFSTRPVMNSLLGMISSLRSPSVIGGGPHANPRDHAGNVVDGHHVADADRPLEEDDQAGDEVGEDLLQAEAQSQAHGGHEPLDLRPAQVPTMPQHSEQADDRDQVATDRGHGVAGAGIERKVLQHGHFQQAGDVLRRNHRRGQDDRRQAEIGQRDRRCRRRICCPTNPPRGRGYRRRATAPFGPSRRRRLSLAVMFSAQCPCPTSTRSRWLKAGSTSIHSHQTASAQATANAYSTRRRV